MDRVASKLGKVAARPVTKSSRSIRFDVASLARFSNGSCTTSLGDTSVLTTAVCSEPSKPSGAAFIPLTVDYKQKAAASGRIPTTHLRRDTGITETEVLTSRMIDRSIRPAFEKGYYFDTQIICSPLSIDGSNDPDVLAINGASTSLAISDIPWSGPIGAARIGLIGETLVTNPTRKEQENSRFSLVLSANEIGNVVMMEGSCNEPVLVNDVMKTIKQGIKECRSVIESIRKLQAEVGKPKKVLENPFLPGKEHLDAIRDIAAHRIREVFTTFSHDKASRDKAIDEVRTKTHEIMKTKFPDIEPMTFTEAFLRTTKDTHRLILYGTGLRCDGRHFDELRPISCQVDLFKPLHGSALFQRGQTQVFCSTTFDSPDAAFKNDPTSTLKEKNFMLHYEFPPFATNEIGRVNSLPDRREIGHGHLAEKSIRPLVPQQDMTLRLSCQVWESNGSSSMASVCAGSMSLMDAGVKIKEHVAGVAMGLVSDLGDRSKKNDGKFTAQQLDSVPLLTDIMGMEDFIGDMDFKISGTKKAVTALQLDVKPLVGLPINILGKALQKAQSARVEIINKMEAIIKTPRATKKDNHPVMKTIYIPPHQHAKFVGFAGCHLKKIYAKFGVRISNYDGSLVDSDVSTGETNTDNFIMFAPNKDALEEAEEQIKLTLEERREPELEFNGIYTATIREIRTNGVMVTLYPDMTPAFLHLSQLDMRAVTHPSALGLDVGQQVQVKYFGRDPASGQMRLSRKSLQMSAVPRVRTPMG